MRHEVHGSPGTCIWRKSKGSKTYHWHPPRHVVGAEGSRVWVAHGMKMFSCFPGQLRRPSNEQKKLIRLLPDHLRVMRSAVAERGGGNVVVLEGGAVPPPDEHHRKKCDQPMNQLDEGKQERQHQREELEDMFGGTVGVVRARDLTEDGKPRNRRVNVSAFLRQMSR